MGVSGTTNRATFSGDGSTTAFSFPYYCFAKADVKVYTYVTATGVASLKALTTDYVINTAADAQGVYGSGLTVTFNSAPASGTTVVIYRNPTQTQTYSLSQNGIISALATVQQFDYLTLLVQRLQDLSTRSVRLSDGVGATFDPTIPATVALNPGAALVVNSSGNGIDLGTNSIRTAVGSPSSATAIVGASGLTWSASNGMRQTIYVAGSGGAVTVSASPPITAGTVSGQEIRLVGTSDTNTVTFENGSGLSINGSVELSDDSSIDLEWDGSQWRECARSE